MIDCTKKRGFSIVEEMVAIAIIMLIIVIFMNSLSFNTKIVFQSGNRTKDISEAQNKLGSAIQSGGSSMVDVTVGTSSYSKNITLNLGSLGSNIHIPGITYTYTDATGKNKTELSTFLPDNK
ncbi:MULTISPECIES: hypothetical protein [Clostridium]|uniref:Prepilin-type N-terminal cleavage/methylation domain-containing protein n=1 Tax=Clostridium frigoriphilum TaxID=443253 RepID=A0ABU7UII7_9CLOT|nr:hypothetical protein [Clostridium sp. DSM 17811]MBU3098247.1 hypothetical protein [Clostridium sp. DSM 17811]